MVTLGTVKAVCTSSGKGGAKTGVPRAELVRGFGIEGDGHGGNWHRQLSLLASGAIAEMEAAGLDLDDGAEPSWRANPDAPFSLAYTSGTTGTPKGMVHDHRARLAFAARFAQAFAMTPDAVAIAATALFTSGTWLMLLPALHSGATMVIMPAFSVSGFQAMVARHRATHTFLVPTAFEALLIDRSFDIAALASMRVWVSAGSALRPDTKRRIDEVLPGEVLELYGCSEGFTTICNRADRARADDIASVGFPPFGWDIRVVRDDNTEAATGELGELVGASEFMLSHYHRKPRATAEAIWRDGNGCTYVRSGDIGKIGADGHVYVVDRKKDMINSGGMNVFASDLEEILLRCPEVREVAVVAAPHAKWGETPLAFVVLEGDHRDTDPDALCRRVNADVAKYQRLSEVISRGPLPRNALGKVLKRELRDPLWSNREIHSLTTG